MNYKFFPHTEEDLKQMLEKSGVSSLDELYADVPEAIRFKGDYDLPEAKSEIELREYLHALTQLDAPLTVFAVQDATTTMRLPLSRILSSGRSS